MVLTATPQQAAARRQRYVTPSGALTHVSTYIGTNKMELAAQGQTAAPVAGASQPMAYLVEQAPGHTVHAHYHQVDQFQLFVGGSGRIGTHVLEGVALHYAGAHSPYGPIVAGEAGVNYMTLRSRWDPGAQWMPDATPALRAVPQRRHVAFTSTPLQGLGQPPAPGVAVQQIMPRDASGASAELVRAGVGSVLHAEPAGSGGMFWVLLSGGLRLADGSVLGSGACLYHSADEVPRTYEAAEGGVELAQARFRAA